MKGDPEKIVLFRGGGVGDFILTLPAMRAIRERFPDSHIALVGNPATMPLACPRGYADSCRSMDHRGFARFFAKGADPDPPWRQYLDECGLAISWLYDPDGIFAANLEAAGARRVVANGHPIPTSLPAAEHFAKVLHALQIPPPSEPPRFFPSEDDRQAAREFLGHTDPRPLVALHPGSGSPKKNWPVERWAETLANFAAPRGLRPVIVCGEADRQAADQLACATRDLAPAMAEGLSLPVLGAVLERCRLFLGHDSGVTHLASAVNTPCLALFGPTDPAIWAPPSERCHILKNGPDTASIPVSTVVKRAAHLWDLG